MRGYSLRRRMPYLTIEGADFIKRIVVLVNTLSTTAERRGGKGSDIAFALLRLVTKVE